MPSRIGLYRGSYYYIFEQMAPTEHGLSYFIYFKLYSVIFTDIAITVDGASNVAWFADMERQTGHQAVPPL